VRKVILNFIRVQDGGSWEAAQHDMRMDLSEPFPRPRSTHLSTPMHAKHTSCVKIVSHCVKGSLWKCLVFGIFASLRSRG